MLSKEIKGSCNDLGCWVGDLLKGCKLCMDGLKTVIFVTGLCPEKCFYCPLSPWRKNSDIAYVNEAKVTEVNDVVIESLISGSKGAGITGGDPLVKLDRTINFIKALKDFFGDEFHIHLYTSGILLGRDKLKRLMDAGLDELRIHVTGDHSWRALKLASEEEIVTAIENPVLPGTEDFLKRIVKKALDLGIKYINLNELEFSETNYEALVMRGFKPSPSGVAAEGSKEVAINLLNWIVKEGLDISVHFCPAVYKDKYQFRKRMQKRGVRTKQFYEELDNGLVRWAEVHECLGSKLGQLLRSGLAVLVGGKVRMHPSLAKELRCKGYIIEAYPTTPRRELNKYLLKD